MAGAPVFARVRSGYISCSISVTGTCTANNYYPGGTQTYSFDAIFTRKSYREFTSNVTSGIDTPYLFVGNDYWGYPTYVKLYCASFYMIYDSKTLGWCLTFFTQFRRYTLRNGTYCRIDGCYEHREYFKSSRIPIPDGTTYNNLETVDFHYDPGFSLTVPDSASLVFNESQ